MHWGNESPHQRVLVVAVAIALAFGAYFFRPYFSVILLSIIMAYLFHPMYKWFAKKTKSPGASASLTFLVSLFIVLIPLALLVFLTVLQAQTLVQALTNQTIDINDIGLKAVNWVNHALQGLPGGYQISIDQVTTAINHLFSGIAQGVLHLLRSSVSSIATFFVTAVLYIYLFVNLLRHSDTLVSTVKRLNPLGTAATNTYLAKMGAMTTAMVRGQFIIATCQGLVGATVLHVAGIHHIFFFMFLLLTVLSIIPLGAGIIIIPAGVYLAFTGHVVPGIIVLLVHFLIITNIDNLLRPHLVPKNARLNSALTILSVFSGVAMFGFLGVVIGPVIMILITTTLHMFLESRKSEEAQRASAKTA
ncbi:MAG TPA: AI-2E family transporter [Patescibacteria group bacterium]|nr:AI-2E family transporter [Patescibacteria group bacterium]